MLIAADDFCFYIVRPSLFRLQLSFAADSRDSRIRFHDDRIYAG